MNDLELKSKVSKRDYLRSYAKEQLKASNVILAICSGALLLSGLVCLLVSSLIPLVVGGMIATVGVANSFATTVTSVLPKLHKAKSLDAEIAKEERSRKRINDRIEWDKALAAASERAEANCKAKEIKPVISKVVDPAKDASDIMVKRYSGFEMVAAPRGHEDGKKQSRFDLVNNNGKIQSAYEVNGDELER